MFWRAKSRLKGIEDFKPEHCLSNPRDGIVAYEPMNGENRPLVTNERVEFEK